MGPIRDRHGPSGHGFDLGTHIWVLHDIFMGQVGMGLIWEHIYESCMTYLWAKWAWVWSGNTYMGPAWHIYALSLVWTGNTSVGTLDLQVLVGWWWGACPGGKVGSLASLWVEATASRWLGLRVVAACGDCGTLWGAMVVRGPVGMTGTFGTCLAGAGR